MFQRSFDNCKITLFLSKHQKSEHSNILKEFILIYIQFLKVARNAKQIGSVLWLARSQLFVDLMTRLVFQYLLSIVYHFAVVYICLGICRKTIDVYILIQCVLYAMLPLDTLVSSSGPPQSFGSISRGTNLKNSLISLCKQRMLVNSFFMNGFISANILSMKGTMLMKWKPMRRMAAAS